MLVSSHYCSLLIEVAQKDSLVLISMQSDADSDPYFYPSLHPELDKWYFKHLLPTVVHSMDSERLLRNLRQVSSMPGTTEIGKLLSHDNFSRLCEHMVSLSQAKP